MSTATGTTLHLRVLCSGIDWLLNRVFDRFPVVLGRDASCDGRVFEVGKGVQVSRFHARVDLTEGELFVTDLGSTNGTFVGGRRLLPRVPELLGRGPSIEFHLGSLRVIGWCAVASGHAAAPTSRAASRDGAR
jgi:predicted component of type VI protein secretion system